MKVLTEEDRFETLVDGLIDTTPAIQTVDMDDFTVQNLINDLGIGMFKPHVVAKRYGLTGAELLDFLKIPEVRRRIKVRKACWEADDNQPERIRRMYAQMTLEAAPTMEKLLHDPATPPAIKLKGMEVTGRFGGADARGGGGVNADAATGPMFSVQFVFAGAGKTESVSILPGQTVIEGDPMP